MNRHPMFCDMQNMMESMMFGKEPENLLDNGSGQSGMGMYCLTNGDKMNGAGLILQGDLMQQVNETEVSTEDRLSDHVQHYDSKEAVMENAEKRASRLEKEKAETKAVEKTVKKDKGQEL